MVWAGLRWSGLLSWADTCIFNQLPGDGGHTWDGSPLFYMSLLALQVRAPRE